MLGRLGDVSQDALVPFVQANIFSTVYLVQAALPYLRNRDQQTRVVVVSSGASTGGYVAWGLYSMSKAAQNSLVRTLGAEEKENGVSFYAVRPGLVDVSAAIQMSSLKCYDMIWYADSSQTDVSFV